MIKKEKQDWRSVKENKKFGIVIYNFWTEWEHCISLDIGSSVCILKETDDWFFGYECDKVNNRGCFPKNFIRISCYEDNFNIVTSHKAIVNEIILVLREWSIYWKELYLDNNPHFEEVKQSICELMGHKSQILSGTLPVDELRDVKQLVSSKIDKGNQMLGLDLVVRDDQGDILKPDHTSAIHLYRQHEIATTRLKKNDEAASVATSYSHSLFVNVLNCILRIPEEAEILMTMFCAKEWRAMSENYLLQWRNGSLLRDAESSAVRVLFTDLASKDLTKEKVYLVCYVIRKGPMEMRENDRRASSQISRRISTVDGLRRPFGVAALDISQILNRKNEYCDEKEYYMPFLPCSDKDFLDTALRKLISMKESALKDHKGQGVWVTVKLFHGDLKQVREENPHLVPGNISIARKIGFPEIILPGDIRNDLYLTILHGEFPKGTKAVDKNVEVTVNVINEKGDIVKGVISIASGFDPIDEYKGVIYYHEDKPKWFETLKVAVSVEEFYSCHLKFSFKHRSSNETKDRNEKPFAIAHVRLMQKNGTTLQDAIHDLITFKVDYKKLDSKTIDYAELPCFRSEIMEKSFKCPVNGLIVSSKDFFSIQTCVCSTKLTQNIDLLGLLRWRSKKEDLEDSLQALMKVNGEEIVKFLQDTLDALFNVLMDNPSSNEYDNLVFEALIFIIGLLVSDFKFHHFQPVLELYISEGFSATLAYNKLITSLKKCISEAENPQFQPTLIKALKCLKYIFKFIIRSRQLFSNMNEDKDKILFENSLDELLDSFTNLMLYESETTLSIQGLCMKYLPSAIPDLLKLYDGKSLSKHLGKLILSLPPKRLLKQKMMTISELIHSQLFLIPDCRMVFLPIIIKQIKDSLESQEEDAVKNKSYEKVRKYFGTNKVHGLHQPNSTNSKEEVELCVVNLGDVLDILYQDSSTTFEDISEISFSILRTVIQAVIGAEREKKLAKDLVAIMISIMRQMSERHYEEYINNFNTPTDLLDFIMEVLMIFRDLLGKNVYPQDWSDMIMLQNSVMLKALKCFSYTIRNKFYQVFDCQVWSNFFYCAIAFVTQPSLQLENFTPSKQSRITARYNDMRYEIANEIKIMWLSLGVNKMQFIPNLVGSILEMTLLPEKELRKLTIPIFFDMMLCEFFQSFSKQASKSFIDTERTENSGNFHIFENEMICKLDAFIEGGQGDEEYQIIFHEIMMEMCENHYLMRDEGCRFVKTVSKLMERLLEYRSVMTDDNKESKMICTVNLLDFYNEIGRQEMYVRYLCKLCNLHLEEENYTEAAFTSLLYTKLLKWSEESLPSKLTHNKFPHCTTHWKLKEVLYLDIIDYLDKGKMWEDAYLMSNELTLQYENICEYGNLRDLLQKKSSFCHNILKCVRSEPEYFRVAFYGKGFPSFLQNKVFIFRGKEYERLSDFSSRICNQFPQSELMNRLSLPTEDEQKLNKQLLQINKVEPIKNSSRPFSGGRNCPDEAKEFQNYNHIQKFTYSRPVRKGKRDSDTDFANLWLERTYLYTSSSLPGILGWFPVISSEIEEITPIKNAIETMENVNVSLVKLIRKHSTNDNIPINTLTLKIKGVIDPKVMGGITNYEKAFFSPTYLLENPSDTKDVEVLKDLIADQIPILETGLIVHKRKITTDLQPLQEVMENTFQELKLHVESCYGKRVNKYLEETRLVQFHTRLSSDTHSMYKLNDHSHVSEAMNNLKASTNQLDKAINLPPSDILSSKKDKLSRPIFKTDKGKDSRRSSFTIIGSPESKSTWYGSQPQIELSQQLLPRRPLRSEAEKERKNSRPSSYQCNNRISTSSGLSSHESQGSSLNVTSDNDSNLLSNSLEEIPPPLPAKSLCYENSQVSSAFLHKSCSSDIAIKIKKKGPPPPIPCDKIEIDAKVRIGDPNSTNL